MINEEQFQAACFQRVWNELPNTRGRLFHVQQKAMNRIEGSRFKAMGVVKGISDFIFLQYQHIVCIELKWEDNVQSREQVIWAATVQALGHIYIVVYGRKETAERDVDDFVQLIKSFI